MKLKIVAIIFLLSNFYKLHSQVGEWDYIDTDYKHSLYNVCERIDSSNLLRSFYLLVNEDKNVINVIEKIDSEGNILKTLTYTSEDKECIFHKAFWTESNESIILVGSTDSLVRVLKLSKDIQILMDTSYDLGFKFIFEHLDGIQTANGDMILVGSSNFIDQTSKNATMNFFKLSKDGYLLANNFIIISEPYGDNCYSIVQDLTSPNYICLGGSKYTIAPDLSSYKKEQRPKIGITSGNQIRILPWDNNYYLIGNTVGYGKPVGFDEGSILIKADTNFTRKKYAGFKNYRGYALPQRAVDFYDRNKIYLGIQEPPPFSPGFSIMQVDSNLVRKWELTLQIDSVHFFMRGMTATDDGGIIVWGSKFLNTPFSLFPYMVKFNENGDLSWTHNIDPKDLLTSKVYPNPSSGIFQIDLKGHLTNADLKILDLNGKNVYVHNHLQVGNNSFDLSGLVAGTYVYKVIQGSKEIFTGKWVKL